MIDKFFDAVFGSREKARPDPAAPATPEQARALEIAARDPDAVLPAGEFDAEGNPIHVGVADLIAHADKVEAAAKTDSTAFNSTAFSGAVAQALGRSISQREAEGIEARIRDAMRALARKDPAA